MDTLRLYVRTLREARGITQAELAEAMDLSLKGFTNWEAGSTAEIKSGPLFRAVEYLRIPLAHLQQLMFQDLPPEQINNLVTDLIYRESKQLGHLSTDAIYIQINEILQIVEALKQHPNSLDRLIGYGQRLIDEHIQEEAA